jgi:hypothetical protein
MLGSIWPWAVCTVCISVLHAEGHCYLRTQNCMCCFVYVCCQVLDVDYAAAKATIKLVPRLDLAAMAHDHRAGARRRCSLQSLHLSSQLTESQLAFAISRVLVAAMYTHTYTQSAADLVLLATITTTTPLLPGVGPHLPQSIHLQARRAACRLAVRLCAPLRAPSEQRRPGSWGSLWGATSRTPAWWCSTHTGRCSQAAGAAPGRLFLYNMQD